MGKPNDLVQGTLDLLILKTLSLEPKHGWAIAKRIEQISNDVLQVQQGSLYPALHSRDGYGANGARAKRAEKSNSIHLHRPVACVSKKKKKAGNVSRRPLIWLLTLCKGVYERADALVPPCPAFDDDAVPSWRGEIAIEQ